MHLPPVCNSSTHIERNLCSHTYSHLVRGDGLNGVISLVIEGVIKCAKGCICVYRNSFQIPLVIEIPCTIICVAHDNNFISCLWVGWRDRWYMVGSLFT